MKSNLFIVFVFSSFFLSSQDKDFQSWNNIEFRYEIIDNMKLSVDNGVRFTENYSVMSKYFFDISVKRKHNKTFSYSIGYRYLLCREINPLDLEQKNRFYLDGYFKKGVFNRIEYSLRTRFQTQSDNEFSSSKELINKLRQRLKLTYDIDKNDMDLVFSIESFYVFGDVVEKIRYQIGCVKPITKKTNLNINYMIQQELGDADLFFVIRAKLSHDF